MVMGGDRYKRKSCYGGKKYAMSAMCVGAQREFRCAYNLVNHENMQLGSNADVQ